MQNFLDWLAPVAKNPEKAWCKYCKCQIAARSSDLKDHTKRGKHLDAAKEAMKDALPNILNHLRPAIADEQKVAELKVAAFIANSSIAFCNVNCLINMITTLFKKDNIAKNMKVNFEISVFIEFVKYLFSI